MIRLGIFRIRKTLLGRGVEAAVNKTPDMELCAILQDAHQRSFLKPATWM